MRSKRAFLRAACFFLLLAPLAVTSTTPDIEWNIFQVDGEVRRMEGSLADHAVVLVGLDPADGGRDWRRLYHCDVSGAKDYGPFTSVSLTGPDGGFALNLAVCGRCDTLAVAVIYPDTMVVGTPFARNSVKPVDIEKTGHTEDDGFLCDSDEEYTYIDGHIFHYPPVTIAVP